MAIGFDIGGSIGYVRPDRNTTRNTKPKVLIASFGDGYEQRIADGINNLRQTFAVAFNNRTKDEIDDIVAFFDSKNGVSAFAYTYPDTNNSGETTVKVVCEDYTLNYTNSDFYGCTATFRRVYEP
jgi:phage-related protein